MNFKNNIMKKIIEENKNTKSVQWPNKQYNKTETT